MNVGYVSSTLAILVLNLCIVGLSVPLKGQTSIRDLIVSNLDYPAPGYFFIAPNAVDSLSMLDHSGKNMYKTSVPSVGNVLPYNLKWYTHRTFVNGAIAFLRRDIDGKVIDTLRPSAGWETDFHECRIITDTSYLILGKRDVTIDLSGVTPGGKIDASVVENVVQERTFAGQTLFEWRSLDRIPVTDATDNIDLTASYIDYIHINSIIKDNDGSYIISARHLDEVIKIKRQTGAIVWRLGGSKSKNNQFRFLNDTVNAFVGFSHQHSVSRTSSGNLLMFDNGNLKPAPLRSRVVEYEMDTAAKTVRATFEFRPTPDIYASTMGSAQELENGNILVGYGSGSANTVAHEVSHNGVIHAQITSPVPTNMLSYRVIKAVFRMTGSFKRVTGSGTIEFTRPDSTTHLSATFSRVDSPTSASAERHSYPPHSITFADAGACGLMPMRWVFRVPDTALVAGTMVFSLGTVPGVEFPDQILLYHRAKEGKGDFSLINASYSGITKQLTVNKLMTGEFLIAYARCFAPSLIQPANAATEIPPAPKLEWTAAVSTGEYQVELSQLSSFSSVYARFTTRRLDTTLASVPEFTKLYWRVRAKRTVGYGPWSEVFHFTTQLSIPSIISPIARPKDTVAIMPQHVFSWSKIKGAKRYHVVITGFGSPIVALDTIVDSTSFVVGKTLISNQRFTWNVRALSDTIVGRLSTAAFFITAPSSPRLVTPPNDATEIATDRPVFVWEEVPGALRYTVTVIRLLDSTVVARDSSMRPPLTIASLPTATRCSWTCRAVGAYGPGPNAMPTTFTTTATSILPAPATIAPKKTGNVDTLAVRFTWTAVPAATLYDLQVTSTKSFTNAEVEIYGLTATEWVMPVLKAGTTYSWRVIAYNGSATGRWSDTSSFTTNASPYQGLVPTYPPVGSINVPLSGVVRYTTAASQFTSYEVIMDQEASFATPEFRFISTSGTCSYAGLLGGTKYFWRVIGKATGEEDVFGNTSDFTTVQVTDVHGDDALIVKSFRVYQDEDVLVIQSDRSSLSFVKASIFNLQGQRISSSEVSNEWVIRLTLQGQARGTYNVILERADGSMESASFTRP